MSSVMVDVVVVIPVIFWIEFVFKFFTSKSYEFVELDDCQVKITLLWVSEILVPVSQTVLSAGLAKVGFPGGVGGGGGSPPPLSPVSYTHLTLPTTPYV